mmetsp:Transcript_23707/g.55283  ORF Transcript_23707/g.55283 Transcript_23707/m.55283 type:complete len:226 (-) Transcript_23707:98-775(-)
MTNIYPALECQIPSLQGHRNRWDVVVPQPDAIHLEVACKLQTQPSPFFSRSRLRVPEVLICGTDPLIEGIARREAPPVPTVYRARVPFDAVLARQIFEENELVHHPTAQILIALHPPFLRAKWIWSGRSWNGLIRRQAAAFVREPALVPACRIATWRLGSLSCGNCHALLITCCGSAAFAAKVIGEVPHPASRVALCGDLSQRTSTKRHSPCIACLPSHHPRYSN